MGVVSAGNATQDVKLGCPNDGMEPTIDGMQPPLAQK